MLNGGPVGFSKSERGVKQGDPLPAYLFIVLLEEVTRGLKGLIASRDVASYALHSGRQHVSNLGFADDLINFTRGLRCSTVNLFAFLEDYKLATGQKISMEKSFFLTSKRCISRQLVFVALSNIKQGVFPFLSHTWALIFSRSSIGWSIFSRFWRRLTARFLGGGASSFQLVQDCFW